MNTPTPPPIPAPAPAAQGTSLGKWLLRIFLGSFLLAVAAPVAVALVVLNLSSDTRALRNSVVEQGGASWDKTIELNVGSIPFGMARMILPLTDAPPEARMALDALRSVEVSVHELRSSEPDRASILAEADRRMAKRGWDRLVGVINDEAAVAVYVQPDDTIGSDLHISVLVLHDKHMVAATGRGRLQPLYDLAMMKGGEDFLAKKRGRGPFVAEIRRN
jgi:hypothetical protein